MIRWVGSQRPKFLDHRLSEVVKSLVLVYRPPLELTRRTNIEIWHVPASIQKTYPLYPYIPTDALDNRTTIVFLNTHANTSNVSVLAIV